MISPGAGHAASARLSALRILCGEAEVRAGLESSKTRHKQVQLKSDVGGAVANPESTAARCRPLYISTKKACAALSIISGVMVAGID
jgi:hypothetical protein